MARYKLKLTSLKFVSSVDTPAQETATARLLKRGPNAPLEVATTARVAKVADELGLVFGWALTTKVAGVDYYDLHGDNIVEDDLIKIAAEWMTAGDGAADTMHDRVRDGAATFCMPMTYEVAKGFFGDKFDGQIGTYGLMVAIRPSPEDFAKFKSGELTGFSIDGTGIREELKSAPHGKSTRPPEPAKVNTMKLVVLTEAQHAHYSKLAPADGEAFVAKSAADRDADIEKAHNADPVIFKGEKTGAEVRKSDGALALQFARNAETQAVELAKAQEQIASRDAAIEKADIRKAAAELLGGMPGDDETHDFIIASLRKGGDPVKAQKALEMLKGMKATSSVGKNAPGFGGTEPKAASTVEEAMSALEKGLETFCKAQNITKNLWTDGLNAFVRTPDGAAMKSAYDESLAG